jgi:hypothetical protein
MRDCLIRNSRFGAWRKETYFFLVSPSGSGGGAVYRMLRIICIASAPKSGAPSLE